MIRVVYIHHTTGEHDLEPFLKDYFVVTKVFADDSGDAIYQGMSVPNEFFDHRADVIVTTLPIDIHKRYVNTFPHIPVVGIHGYHGMYSEGKQREVWKDHAKGKGIKVPHSFVHKSSSAKPFHEIRNNVFLPSSIHVPGNEYSRDAITTFPELQEYISNFQGTAHIERYIKGEHVYIISIKDFRDQDIYTTPLLQKTDHGYKVCSHIKGEQKDDAIRFAREMHEALGLGPVAQFEFVVSSGDLYLVHVEPNPKHTDNSALHAGLASVGSSMKDLWKNIVENARKKK